MVTTEVLIGYFSGLRAKTTAERLDRVPNGLTVFGSKGGRAEEKIRIVLWIVIQR